MDNTDGAPVWHAVCVQRVKRRHHGPRYDVLFGSKRIAALSETDARTMAGLIAQAINTHSVDAAIRETA